MHGTGVKGLIQRVANATVVVEAETVGVIGRGLFVLVGVGHDDEPRDAEVLADRVIGLRIFPDDEGKMNLSLREVAGELLVVSQFTLLGDTRRGRRPSFVGAAAPERAAALIEHMVATARALGVGVATGRFGADMKISVLADGPVTLLLDTREKRSGS